MIENLLDKLAEIQSAADALRLDYEQKRAAIMAQVQDELDALNAEYQPSLDAASENAATITEAIKTAVIEQGASAKGAHLHAVYTGGRITTDNKIVAAGIEKLVDCVNNATALFAAALEALSDTPPEKRLALVNIGVQLSAMQVAIEKINAARKVGAPSVSIRAVKR